MLYSLTRRTDKNTASGRSFISQWLLFCVALSIVLNVGGASNPLQGQTCVRMETKGRDGSPIVVPIVVNGQGPFRFMIDTGLDTSLLAASFVSQSGVALLDKAILNSTNGSRTLSRGFIEKLTIAGLTVRDLEFLQLPMGRSSLSDAHAVGVIGQNLLSQFNVLVDQARGVFCLSTFSDPPPRLNGVRIPLIAEHGRPTLWGETEDHQRLRLVLDSGSSNVTLFTKPGSKSMLCRKEPCLGRLQSALAASSVERMDVRSLTVGDLHFHDLLAFFSPTKAAGDDVDGLLPTALFSQIFINNSVGYAVLASRN